MNEREPQPFPTPSDMLDLWRKAAGEMEQRWNEYLNQMMGTEAFAQNMARSMDTYLTMQATLVQTMERYLHALNIPTHSDIQQLAERIGLLEQHLAEIAVAGVRGEGADETSSPAPRAARPRRIRGRGEGDSGMPISDA